jgi:hypothetical protein
MELGANAEVPDNKEISPMFWYLFERKRETRRQADFLQLTWLLRACAVRVLAQTSLPQTFRHIIYAAEK